MIDQLASRGPIPMTYEALIRACRELGLTHRRAEAVARCTNMPGAAVDWNLDRLASLVESDELAHPECVVVAASSIPENAVLRNEKGESLDTLVTAGLASGTGAYALSPAVREVPRSRAVSAGYQLAESLSVRGRDRGLPSLPVVFTGNEMLGPTRSALSTPEMLEQRAALDQPLDIDLKVHPGKQRMNRHPPMIAEIPFTSSAFAAADSAELLLRGDGRPMVRRARGNRAIKRLLLDVDTGNRHDTEQRYLDSAFKRRIIDGYEILISLFPGYRATSGTSWVAASRLGLVRPLSMGSIKPPVAMVEIVDGAAGPSVYDRATEDAVFLAISAMYGAGKEATATCLDNFVDATESTLYRDRGSRKRATRDVQLNLLAARHVSTGPYRVRKS